MVWFRRDLRLADNAALKAALDRHAVVIPVYVHAPADEGAWRAGAAANGWLHHSLAALARRLKAKGAPLVVRRADTAETALDALVLETGATAVYWNVVYEPAIYARDTALEARLQDQGLTTGRFLGASLVEPWLFRTATGGPYHRHAPYWRALRGWLDDHPDLGLPLPAPRRVSGPAKPLASLSIDDLGLLSPPGRPRRFPEHGTPGEKGAHARWRAFAEDALRDYRQGRQRPTDEGPATAGASRLSVALHFGEVTPRQLWADVQARVAGHRDDLAEAEAQAFLGQLGWREFAHHLLWHTPSLPDRAMTGRFDRIAWRDPGRDAAAASDFAAWTAGRTGYPFLDAGLRQLRRTGYLHSRLRMVTAMALVKNLLIDWRAGERWFWETLVDADLASNAYNWQWVAGIGADAHPFFRVFNPVTQGERFDPEGVYARRWVPEVARLPSRYLHAPWTAPAAVLASAGLPADSVYRRPVFDVAESRARALHAYRSVREANAATAW